MAITIDFVGSPTEGGTPLVSTFTPTVSLGGSVLQIIGYKWVFGDGFISAEKSPNHTYRMSGIYTVTLTVEFSDGSTLSETKTSYIKVSSFEEGGDSTKVIQPNKSYSFGIRENQGIGIRENTGADWVIPEARCGVMPITDRLGNRLTLIYDYSDGYFYNISTRDTGGVSGYSKIWNDKYISPESPGSPVVPKVWFKEDRGTYESYVLENNGNQLFLRPEDDGNEFPGELELTYTTYADGDRIDEKASLRDITKTKGDLIFDKKNTGNRIQQCLEFNLANITLTGRQTYYKVSDRPSRGPYRTNTEDTWDSNVSDNMTIWFSRTTDFKDRINGTEYDAEYTTATGADNISDSAQVLSEDLAVVNSVSSRIQLWTTDASAFITDFNTLNSITLVDSGTTSNGFSFISFEGVVPANLTIPSSTIFDFRCYSNTLDSNAVLYYTDDISKFEGINTCPL